MLLILPVFLLIGLFLPGFFITRCLRRALWLPSAFAISLLVLFHSIFWLGVLHIPITLWTVLPVLLAASGVAAWLQRKFGAPAATNAAPPFTREEQILLLL